MKNSNQTKVQNLDIRYCFNYQGTRYTITNIVTDFHGRKLIYASPVFWGSKASKIVIEGITKVDA